MSQTLTEAQMARVVAAFNNMTSRRGLMQRLGTQYGGKRDVYKAAGYPQELGFDDYWGLYRRGDVAGRVVDMAAQTTWRDAPEIVEPGMDFDNKPEFVKQVEELADRLRLWSTFERADRLAGVGRYSVILIGVAGEDAALKTELPKLGGPQDVLYLGVYHEKAAKIKSWVTDHNNPRFGLPELYEIDFSSGVKEFEGKPQIVHASRIIHIAEDKLEDNVFGRPRLERVYNRFMDLEKVAAATGEAFWQLAHRILTGSIDPGAELAPGEGDRMVEQLEEITHDLRRIFLGQGVELDWLQSTPPDPGSAADLYLTLIAGATAYPKRVLFGSETGERASEQDLRHYYGTIDERRSKFAEAEIIRPFLDRLIEYGGLAAPSEGSYDIQWQELWHATDQERAEASGRRAETAKSLTPLGGNPLHLVEIDDRGDVWLKSTAALEEDGILEEMDGVGAMGGLLGFQGTPEPDPVEGDDSGGEWQ